MSDAPQPARIVGTDRRTLVRHAAVLGVGGVSLPLLAACGPLGGDETEAEKPSSGQKIAATSDVPVGGGVILDDPGIVLTQPTEGTFKAFSPICPHQGCSVTKVTDGEIDCPCHGSRFSIEDGSVKQGPAQKGLEKVAVTVSGNEIVGA
ncbi:iron-sulfur protein [Marmoricola endophyticus]|uniref:Cytochrome bc1 complex Rieske iron-sulfur subunit n=1 Tax=Marmoricola endophyticus TaxID=2040280 RepID=A0A917B9T6_9ACTN|nr:Rieske (2Fe-2S) protein [Marmoricola endophyticus]GGF33478.1 iron-sulfur protein [Marmoricola endophyticus]